MEENLINSSIPPRTVSSPKKFVIEVGVDGFNAYQLNGPLPAEGLDLFAASSSVGTFLKVMETIVNSNGNAPIRFAVIEDAEENA